MKPLGPGVGWTVLVTGASSGLGRAIALELADAGCGLILSGRNPERLELVAAECRLRSQPLVHTILADLAEPEGALGLLAAIKGQGWRPDALVNNAGAGWSGPWIDSTSERDRALVRLLVEAPLALTRGLVEQWRAQGRGALLNVASTGGFQPGPLTAVYYAAKSFLLSWSMALAREERSWLRVTTLCPGALKTGFAAAAGKNDVSGAPVPEKAAREAVRAWQRGRSLVIPGTINKVLVACSRLFPLAWVAAGVEAVQRSVRKGS